MHYLDQADELALEFHFNAHANNKRKKFQHQKRHHIARDHDSHAASSASALAPTNLFKASTLPTLRIVDVLSGHVGFVVHLSDGILMQPFFVTSNCALHSYFACGNIQQALIIHEFQMLLIGNKHYPFVIHADFIMPSEAYCDPALLPPLYSELL